MSKKTCKGCRALKFFSCTLHYSNVVDLSLHDDSIDIMKPLPYGGICPKPKTKKEYTRLFIEKFGRHPDCTDCKALSPSSLMTGGRACELGYPVGMITGGDFHGGVEEFRPHIMCPKPTSLEKYYKLKLYRGANREVIKIEVKQ